MQHWIVIKKTREYRLRMEGKLSAALDLLLKKKQEYRIRMEGKLSAALDLLLKKP